MNLLVLFVFLIIGCNNIPKNDDQVSIDTGLKKREALSSVNTAQQIYKPFKLYHKDTLQYLKQNFVEHKDYYLNKPLKVLITQLEIDVDHVIPVEVS